MDRLIWFALLLTYLSVTESLERDDSCLSQPNKVMKLKTGKSAELKCIVGSNCSDLQYEWFAFKFTSKEINPLNLSDSLKYTLDRASLKIKSLEAGDSGVYFCAVASSGDPAPGKQYVGLGTTLEVIEQMKKPVRFTLLWVSFVLLAIYSLAIVTLMIKKYGCNVNVSRRICKTESNLTKKARFRNVLQEMHSRGTFHGGKNTASTIQAEAASADFNTSTDDIYQNV